MQINSNSKLIIFATDGLNFNMKVVFWNLRMSSFQQTQTQQFMDLK